VARGEGGALAGRGTDAEARPRRSGRRGGCVGTKPRGAPAEPGRQASALGEAPASSEAVEVYLPSPKNDNPSHNLSRIYDLRR